MQINSRIETIKLECTSKITPKIVSHQSANRQILIIDVSCMHITGSHYTILQIIYLLLRERCDVQNCQRLQLF